MLTLKIVAVKRFSSFANKNVALLSIFSLRCIIAYITKICGFCKTNIFRKSHEKDLFNCAKQKKLCTLNGDGGNFYPPPPVSLEGLKQETQLLSITAVECICFVAIICLVWCIVHVSLDGFFEEVICFVSSKRSMHTRYLGSSRYCLVYTHVSTPCPKKHFLQ